jgi:hypothetical protein
MNLDRTRKYVYVRRMKRYAAAHPAQVTIILVFILLSTLISVLLPVYFANLPLQGL